MTEGALDVSAELSIPRRELAFRASRSGGPGGQHVNTSSTRVELLWNVDASRALSDQQRQRLREKLGTRIDSSGTLRVVGSVHRSQSRNREDAEKRLAAMLRRALAVPAKRRRTRPSKSAVEQRLREKKLASERKRARRRDYADE